jgi:uncharacterized caspase-like protein
MAGARIALVIGVNEAPGSELHTGDKALHHAETDARAMTQVLEACCGFQVVVPPLLGAEATSDRIKKTILRQLGRDRRDEDFLLLYFSGHAHPMTIEADEPDVYFVTTDFDPCDVEDDPESHWSMRWLWKTLYTRTQAGKVLLILDCCYSGDMGQLGPVPTGRSCRPACSTTWEHRQPRRRRAKGGCVWR